MIQIHRDRGQLNPAVHTRRILGLGYDPAELVALLSLVPALAFLNTLWMLFPLTAGSLLLILPAGL